MDKRLIVAAGVVAVAGGLAARRIALREDLDWDTVEKPGRIVDVDGYGVHVVEQGAGPAVVLVHGFGGHTFSYRHLLPLLARTHRVVAVDLKGYGYSQRDAATGLAESDQVAMLRGLLDALRIDRAVFVGHSMGGGIVQRFAAAYPDRVEALVLAASVVAGAREPLFRLPAALVRPLLPLLASIAADRLLALSFYDRANASEEVRAEYLRPARIRGSMDGLLSAMRDSRRGGPCDFEQVRMPVLILSGGQDRVVPLSAARHLRERLPHARLVVLDGAGHMLLEERPEDCFRAIEDFLRESGEPREPALEAR